MINPTINAIITETQTALMSAAPAWETKEEYMAYVTFEQEVAETIRSLDSILHEALNDGADKNTLKRIAVNFVS